MLQLRLFGHLHVVHPPLADAPLDRRPPTEPLPVAGTQGAQDGQLGLFDRRLARLRALREAIAAGELSAALRILEGLEDGPDEDLPALRTRVKALRAELGRALRSRGSARVMELAVVGRHLHGENEPWAALGRHVLRLAAEEADRTADDAIDPPAGRLWLEAGALHEARASLLAALGRRRRAELLFFLGDVETRLGETAAARRHYRDALLLDPFDSAFLTVLDDEVRELPELTEGEFEMEEEPRAWAAPVGVVTGLFVCPREPLQCLPESEGWSERAREALGRARRFLEALAQAASPEARRDPEALVEARRTMKRVCPALFARYLARIGGSGT